MWMPVAKKIIKIVRNQYLVTLIAFILLLLFFDRNDLFSQLEKKRELKALQTSKQFYIKEIEKAQKELNEIKNNPAALEKYAREHFLMKRDGEDVFIIDSKESADSIK